MYKQKVIYSHMKQFIQMLGKRGLFMEKKKAIEKFLRTMMLIIMSAVICLGITKSAYAKVSDSTKIAAKKAYQNHMKKQGGVYFTMWDVDRDGLKELLVTSGYPKVGNTPEYADVYTYVNGKVKYAGKIGSPMSGISYNSSTKRLHASRGGGGSIEYWYYTLTKNKKVRQVMCGAYINGVKNGKEQYRCIYNGKSISFNKWLKITKKWSSQSRDMKYYWNTQYNREKYI